MDSLKIHFTPSNLIPDLDLVIADLRKILDPERISTNVADKIAYGKDYWVISCAMTLEGTNPAFPDIIVWPKTQQEISQILRYATQHSPPIPVIPYGEGSGVVGSALAVRGGIVMDMKYFDSIEINPINMTARIGAGVNGTTLERYLNERGFRMGHIPQSVRFSTLGGYLANRAAGQFSGKYGKIEDIVLGIEVVLPSGDILVTKVYPRAAVGPLMDKLFIGSEGTLGVFTYATCRIWPFPEKESRFSFLFPSLQTSLDAIRTTLQSLINPAVIRIYDPIETNRHFGSTLENLKNQWMTIFVCEGPSALVDVETEFTKKQCLLYQGKETGESPVSHWFDTRFIPKETTDYDLSGAVYDTIEMAVMWDHATDLYTNVMAAFNAVPGTIMASSHASHFYPSGVCFYFTFFGYPRIPQTAFEYYNTCWDAAMQATLASEGAISHHHGIGINRTRWMQAEHHDVEFHLLQQIKHLIDPYEIMNPGKLYDGSVQKTKN